MEFKHIISDPDILGGKPIINGSRISVQLILEWISTGASIRDLALEFPHLPVEGIKEAVLYAAHFLDNDTFIEVKHKRQKANCSRWAGTTTAAMSLESCSILTSLTKKSGCN